MELLLFMKPEPTPLSSTDRATLYHLARQAISAHLVQAPKPTPSSASPSLTCLGASFITLTQQGNLRGCIGTLTPHRPLWDDVITNAQKAAFHDPRFLPLTSEEWPQTFVEVSVLHPAQPIHWSDENDLLSQLAPHRDGLTLTAGRHHATFLPSVWEQLPDPTDFLRHLKKKAGLSLRPLDTSSTQCEKYTVTKITQTDYEIES